MRLIGLVYCLFLFGCSDSRNVIERLNNSGAPQAQQSVSLCLERGADETLSVGTWNLQDFPKSGSQTVQAVAQVIDEANWDILAIQELTSKKVLNQLLQKTNGLTGSAKYLAEMASNSFFPVGLIYNQEKLRLLASEELFTDNRYAFPRPALWSRFEVKQTGQVFSVLNIHLKCCRGVDNTNRRHQAIKLIDQFVRAQTDEMIILGDFNHDVVPGREDSPYRVFLENDFYEIADLEIATGVSQLWSYPKGPYHIDHIILSGALVYQKISVNTAPLDKCRRDYFDIFSDHRPVSVELSL